MLRSGWRQAWRSDQAVLLLLGFLSCFTVANPIPVHAQDGFPEFQPAPAPQQIRWKLENPFRLFLNPSTISIVKKAYKSLPASEQDDSPVLSGERLLQTSAGASGWASSVFRDACGLGEKTTHADCKSYVAPVSHRVVVELSGDAAGTCDWLGFDALRRPIKKTSAPCGRPVVVSIPYPAGGYVEVHRDGVIAAKQFIRVQDLLIVGLGDSMGSGEGNPDRPVTFDDSKVLSYGKVVLARRGWFQLPTPLKGYPQRAGKWEQLFDAAFESAGADWMDRQCHRSLYSYQMRTAMQLALENERRAVTFVGLACTGSDTLEGIFLKSAVRECVPGRPAEVPSQLGALSAMLCRTKTEQRPLDPDVSSLLGGGKPLPGNPTLQTCPSNQLRRKPDLILLSLGGNDIGFSEMIADAILHRRSFYRGLAQRFDSIHGAERGAEKLKLLPDRYRALARQFSLSFGLPKGAQQRVLFTAYPDMGYKEDGKSICSGSEGMEVFPAFSLDEEKAKRIEALAQDLYGVLTSAAAEHGWTLVDGHKAEFRSHGLCAQSRDRQAPVADGLKMPLHTVLGWSPYKPSVYRPYASRTRWVRTPNDAFMTVNYHQQAFGRTACVPLGGIVQNPFQLFLAGTYGGAFHPSAEGQAAIADATVKRARDILNGKRVASR